MGRRISDCVRRLQVDIDGDGELERLCFREAWIRVDQCRTPFNALIGDVFKDEKWILRQHLKQGVFHEERFFLVNDLDNDGKTELITRLQLSPDCAGCAAYAVYVFTEGSFVAEMNLFGVSPRFRPVASVFCDRAAIRDTVDRRYRIELSDDNPCGFPGKPSRCGNGSLWLLDSNHVGNTEIIHVSSEYWPPGKSHADVILEYEIMAYKNGTYEPASPAIGEMTILDDETDSGE